MNLALRPIQDKMYKQLWITFYDIEKCFDSLWLEDFINSLWDNGIKDDTLSLIYCLNAKANVIVKTPFGDTNPLHLTNIIKQGTVLGPMLNNCSLDRVCKEGYSYHLGSVEIRPMEFVDDIADPDYDEVSAKFSNKIVEQIQYEKRLTLPSEKYELLKVNSRCKHGSIIVNGENIKSVGVARYLGDQFNSKGDYVDLCKERVGRAKGSTFELIALCREVKFGTRYQSVFLPRLIYNCESWSNMTDKDYQALQSAQLLYLRNVMEVPRGTPIAALYLELGILPIQFEIEKRQLLFLRLILDKDFDDPLQLVYNEQLKYEFEKNWANFMLELRRTYNLPLRNENVKKMSVEQWKAFVHNVIREEAFTRLRIHCAYNRKTCHLHYGSFSRAEYTKKLQPNLARVIFKARTRMFDIKVNFKKKYHLNIWCPFYKREDKTFDHIFACNCGVFCPTIMQSTHLTSFSTEQSLSKLKKLESSSVDIPDIGRKYCEMLILSCHLMMMLE